MYPTVAELLPVWARVVGVVLLLGVLAVLGRETARTSGPARRWHAVYVVVAAGMVLMYAANPLDTPGFSAAGLLVFVVALVGVVAVAVAAVRHRGAAAWLVALADVVTLAYVQIPAAVRPVVVCVLFACYLAVQVGLRVTVAVRALRGAPQRASRTLVDPGGRTVPAEPDARPGRSDAVVPIALAVLALAMLYVLSV
ncbi:hypothetical protein [Actinomycetospora sp. TBRC 11914]|uniref:hypothetical protein n=1 Tax=Actinomycetospora sp. TBRC 11914 TaxID=2729387 RepID=UPI00145E87C0|nr:hypothetical protein [Actinomycetospora sp. TBRC 11914]NMO92260.1 hypothetical protein [Actinomycetospora sp. TBRC 11914]